MMETVDTEHCPGSIRSLFSHALTGSYLNKLYKRPGYCIPRGDTVTEWLNDTLDNGYRQSVT